MPPNLVWDSSYVWCPVHSRQKKSRFLFVASVTRHQICCPLRIFFRGYLQGHLNTLYDGALCSVKALSHVLVQGESLVYELVFKRSIFVEVLFLSQSLMSSVDTRSWRNCLYFKCSRSTVSPKQSVIRIKAASLDFAARSFWRQVMILCISEDNKLSSCGL